MPIDLKEHSRIWEDFCDGLIAEQRKNEPRTPWADVKKALGLERTPDA